MVNNMKMVDLFLSLGRNTGYAMQCNPLYYKVDDIEDDLLEFIEHSTGKEIAKIITCMDKILIMYDEKFFKEDIDEICNIFLKNLTLNNICALQEFLDTIINAMGMQVDKTDMKYYIYKKLMSYLNVYLENIDEDTIKLHYLTSLLSGSNALQLTDIHETMDINFNGHNVFFFLTCLYSFDISFIYHNPAINDHRDEYREIVTRKDLLFNYLYGSK